MKKRIIAFLLCFALVMPILPVRAATNELTVSAASVTLPQYEKQTITAAPAADVQVSAYQWQIKIPNTDTWVNISGANEATLTLTYAMVASLLSGDQAQVRCQATANGAVVTTDAVTVTMDYTSTPAVTGTTETAEPQVLTEAQVISGPTVTSPSTTPAATEAAVDVSALIDAYDAACAAEEEAKKAVTDAQAAYDSAATAENDAKTALDNAQADYDAAVAAATPAETTAVDPTAESTEAPVVTVDSTALDAAKAAHTAAQTKTAEAKTALDNAQAALTKATDARVAAEDALSAAQSAAATPAVATFGLMTADADVEAAADEGSELKKYSIVINYVFEDTSIAAEPYTATLAEGSSFSATIKNPVIQGYQAYYNNAESESIALNVQNISADVTYTVTYQPTLVNYTVKHLQQNADNDEYTVVETETLQGLTNSTVGEGNNPDVANTYEGFYALLYENPKIAADGSTVVEVKYDRYYYLMSFDLDGGYGVEPIYARYGSSIGNVGTPTKAGYTFAGWTLNDESATLPSTMPYENRTYKAVWTANNTAQVLVVVWGENANDTDYSYVETVTVTATPGQTINYTNIQNNISMDSDLWTYAKSDTITVEADGSSVMNVYFNRVLYTFTFNVSGRTIYSFSAKWGSNIREKWTFTGTNGVSYSPANQDSWTGNTLYTARIYMVEIMPTTNITFTRARGNNSSRTFYYYVESLENSAGDNKRQFEQKYYDLYFELVNDFNTLYLDEDFFELEGFTRYKSAREDGEEYPLSNGGTRPINPLYFYYARNVYDIQFYNPTELIKTVDDVPYQSPLGEYDFTPTADQAPEKYEPGSVEFAGWYLNPECTGEEYILSEHTMPLGTENGEASLSLYAKWVPVTHTVEFYLDAASLAQGTQLESHPTVEVVHGSKVDPTPEEPENGNYTFIGWFYTEDGVEKAFDFANMPVNKDLKVYGKWSSNTKMPYTIYYKIQGTETEIADRTTGEGLVDLTKTFDAKGGNDLYLQYREGYFPVAKSHSMTININGGNEYTFEYVQKDAVPYTVHYVTDSNVEGNLGTIEIDGKTYYKVAESYTNSENRKAVVTENFVVVSGFMPDEPQKRLVVSGEDGAVNEIIFYYEEDTTHSYYKITHYTQNTDGVSWSEYLSDTYIGDKGTTYTASAIEISGFTYDSTVEGTVTEGVLGDDLLELKLYYTRNKYPYIVRYLEKGTDVELADEKTGAPEYHGKPITETAINIDGYTVDGNATQMLTIQIEPDPTNVQLNIITFYYEQTPVTIKYQVVGRDGCGTVNLNDNDDKTVPGLTASETVGAKTGTPVGATAAAADAFKFVGWYTHSSCEEQYKIEGAAENYVPTKADTALWVDGTTYYAKFEYNLTTMTITKTLANGYDDEQDTFIFDVAGNDGSSFSVTLTPGKANSASVTISNVPVGVTYTVTERAGGGSNRYSASKVPSEGLTLGTDATKNVVTFTNTLSKTQWLTASDVKHNVFG